MVETWHMIRIRETTAKKLQKLGKMGDSYDTVIKRLIKDE